MDTIVLGTSVVVVQPMVKIMSFPIINYFTTLVVYTIV